MTTTTKVAAQTDTDHLWQAVGETAQDLATTRAPFVGGRKISILEQVGSLVSKHGGSQLGEAFAKFMQATERACAAEDPCATCGGTGERDYGKGEAAYADACDACGGRGYDL